MGFKREDIRDTSPLSLKKLNDTIRFIWLKLFGNIDFADLSQSAQGVINNKVSSSDFSSLIEQNPNSVKIAVGQIGGNNLIKDSSFEMGTTIPVSANSAIVTRITGSDIAYGSYCIEVNPNSNSNAGCYIDVPNLTIGKRYTFSLTLSDNGANHSLNIYAYTTSWAVMGYENIIMGGISRPSLTFTATSTTVRLAVVAVDKLTQKFWTDAWKLEEGDNATAWSPNANEIKTAVAEVNDDHLRVTFNNGNYSEMNNQGFKWHNQDNSQSYDYHYLSYVGQVDIYSTLSSMGSVVIQLPDRFKGKSFAVTCSHSGAKTPDGYPYAFYGFGAFANAYDYTNATFTLWAYASWENQTGQVKNTISYTVIA